MKPLPLLSSAVLLLAGASGLLHAGTVKDDVIGVQAVAQTSPAKITLNWQPEQNTGITVTDHRIFRRTTAAELPPLTSTDGLSWSPMSAYPNAAGMVGVAFASISGSPLFVAVSEEQAIYRSANGTSWTRWAMPELQSWAPSTVAFGNGRFVTGCGGYFFSSTDGITWTQSPWYYATNSPFVLHDLHYANGTWVAVGQGQKYSVAAANGDEIGRRMGILTSTDGLTWTIRMDDNTTGIDTSGAGQALRGVAFGASAWVTVGLGGNIYRSTNNGSSWSPRTSGTTAHLNGVAYGAGKFIAVGASANSTNGTPVILQSTEGLTWSTVSLGGSPATRQSLNRVRFINSQFHAVGDNGAYIVSSDGLTWTARTTGSTASGRDIVQGDGRFMLATNASWGTPILSGLAANALTCEDASAQAGIAYDYTVARRFLSSGSAFFKADWISAGIQLPIVESLGTVVLVTENTIPTALASDYQQFKTNLIGDGWKVEEILVPRALTSPTPAQRLSEVQTIRSAIQALYQANPTQVNTVVLLGRVPVPISGYVSPDGHAFRPFPADTYYGDMTGTWTDTKSATGYTAGDGKFDQDKPPVIPQLAVCRVDFGEMSSFSQTETQLIQRYLVKNHKFRHGITTAERRSFTANNWGSTTTTTQIPDGPSVPHMKGYSSALGYSTVGYSMNGANVWKSALNAGSYLFSYGSGPGTNTSASGIVTTTEFAAGNYQTIFMGLSGSYFGEYNLANNLMRASLGMPDYGLVSVYGGAMPSAMGLAVPYSRYWRSHLTMPGDTLFSLLDNQLHTIVHGDGTLRAFSVKPASSPSLSASAGQITINWTASPDTDLVGYHVYRATSPAGPYTRLTGTTANAGNPTGSPVAGTSFTDTTVVSGTSYTYMIRAVKAESGNCGTFHNLSQGIFVSNQIPAVTSGQTAQGYVGLAFSYQIQASDNPTSYALASGSLPPGVTLNTTTGLLSGTPTAAGTYTPAFTATNAFGTSTAVVVTITVSISSVIVSEPFNYTLSTTNPDPDGGGAANSGNGLPATNIGGSPSGTSTGLYGSYGADHTVVAGLTYSDAGGTLTTSANALRRTSGTGFSTNLVRIYRQMSTDPFAALRSSANANVFGWNGSSAQQLFFSVLLNVNAVNTGATNRFVLNLGKDNSSYNVYFSQDNGTTQWRYGDQEGTGATLGTATANQTVLIVGRLSFNSATQFVTDYWFNPPLGQALGTPTFTKTHTTTTSGGQFNGIQTRDGANILTCDEFRMGTSAAAVMPHTPAATPPAAPSGLSATANSGSQITLNWTDNANNETGFKLERSPNGSSAWTQIATPATNATSFVDTGLSAGTASFYRIRATNAAGDSATSNVASATTFTGLQTFRATHGLTADGSQDLLLPAGDGVANLLKYAFNMIGELEGQAATLANPNTTVLAPGDSAGLPLAGVDGTGKLQITYIRRKAASQPGITYSVEWSDTLASGSWTTNPSASENVTSLDAIFERVTLTDSATFGKRFVRVRVAP
jgi:fibronectin type 3 domain-containing protein